MDELGVPPFQETPIFVFFSSLNILPAHTPSARVQPMPAEQIRLHHDLPETVSEHPEVVDFHVLLDLQQKS